MKVERAVIIRDKTRLELLLERFNSKAQAKFYIEANGGQFELYEGEHDSFYRALDMVEGYFAKKHKVKIIDRSFIPTYIFGNADLVVVIGQDGLVANAAKYVGDRPILSINPDEARYDGILLQTNTKNFKAVYQRFLAGDATTKEVTMAKARLQDGQELLAFNDFFIGAASHVSARYKIQFNGREETQSSSGVIVSTGAGATGWLSSVFNMARNISIMLEQPFDFQKLRWGWEEDCLMFVAREPFKSKLSQASLGTGIVRKDCPLIIESQMASNGIIFSDGVEADFLSFNSGAKVEISLASQKAKLLTLG